MVPLAAMGDCELAWRNVGMILTQAARYAGAEGELAVARQAATLALRLNPSPGGGVTAAAWGILARVAYIGGDRELATAWAEKVLALDPASDAVWRLASAEDRAAILQESENERVEMRTIVAGRVG